MDSNHPGHWPLLGESVVFFDDDDIADRQIGSGLTPFVESLQLLKILS